jgi:hypothetical protein
MVVGGCGLIRCWHGVIERSSEKQLKGQAESSRRKVERGKMEYSLVSFSMRFSEREGWFVVTGSEHADHI